MTQPTIAIIGGGAAGMLTAANLMCKPIDTNIIVVNSGNSFGTGVAYHPQPGNLLLNVMARRMSAYTDQPGHFVQWLADHALFPEMDKELLGAAYLPRAIYGQYLQSVWNSAKDNRYIHTSVIEKVDHVTNVIHECESGYTVLLKSGEKFFADAIVLATGNARPRNPSISNMSFYESNKYLNNPWGMIDYKVERDSNVLILGNGLTMVDVVQTLFFKKEFNGTVHSISPNGFGILQHQHNGLCYNGMINDLTDDLNLLELVRLLNKHIKKVREVGLSTELVIDSLRPKTQKIWKSLSLDEKKKFLNRLRHLWGVARHRLPIQVYDFIQQLKIDGRLKIWAGSIQNIREFDGEVKVDFFDKKSNIAKSMIVSQIINCTGPETDIERMEDHLFTNLISSGMILPDPLRLGLEADPASFQVINKTNNVTCSFYAIGGLLRGLLWESTAIPEIRLQAKIIADHFTQSWLRRVAARNAE